MTSDAGLARATGYVDTGGERIYYETTGHGHPVVLCHGLGGNHASWWQQIEAFAGNHTVVTWDQRGFGNSTTSTDDVGPVAARRDLLALIDHLGYDTVDLVGQSMGGWVALGFALAHPERTRRLVLSTTLAGAERRFVDDLVRAEPGRSRFNRREHPVLTEEFCRDHPDLGVLYNQISSFGARPAPDRVLQAMADDRFDPHAVSALSVPTLVVMAADDHLCPPSAMEPVVASLPAGHLVEVPGGHSAYWETPDAWNQPILRFLDGAVGTRFPTAGTDG